MSISSLFFFPGDPFPKGLASEVVTALREGSAFAAKEAFRTSERSRASSLGVERERLTTVAKATSDGGAAVAVKLARSREGQIYEDVEAELRLLHAISKVQNIPCFFSLFSVSFSLGGRY